MNALAHMRGSPIVALDAGGPFNTIATGAAASGRLLDLTAGQLAAMRRGALAWVESVKDYFRWDPTSTLTADNVTVCNPTINIGNNGRLVRCLVPAPEWMLQTTWIVDETNSTGVASDENVGGTIGAPLLTDLERQRRMGTFPRWSQSEYHLRYVSDVTSTVVIDGYFTTTTGNIWIHGNQVNGQGKAVLKTLAVDAIVATDRTTNVPLKFTSNGLTTSWTADGLLNTRCRMTSGANIGGYVWPMLDLGSKQAMMSETLIILSTAFSNPYTFPFNLFTPALNDTFVVESLVSIKLSVGLVGYGNASATSVILDSVFLSALAYMGTTNVQLIGCDWGAVGSPSGLCKGLTIGGSRLRAGTLIEAGQITTVSCYADDSTSTIVTFRQGNSASGMTSFIIVQRNGINWTNVTHTANATGQGTLTARFTTSLGIFNNSAGAAVGISGNVHIDPACRVWGVCGAGGPPFFLRAPGCRLIYGGAIPGPAAFYTIDVTAAPSGAWVGYHGDSAATAKYTAPAFDPATSTFTSYRTLTPANLQAALGSGGLNGQWFDPVTQCAMVAS